MAHPLLNTFKECQTGQLMKCPSTHNLQFPIFQRLCQKPWLSTLNNIKPQSIYPVERPNRCQIAADSQPMSKSIYHSLSRLSKRINQGTFWWLRALSEIQVIRIALSCSLSQARRICMKSKKRNPPRKVVSKWQGSTANRWTHTMRRMYPLKADRLGDQKTIQESEAKTNRITKKTFILNKTLTVELWAPNNRWEPSQLKNPENRFSLQTKRSSSLATDVPKASRRSVSSAKEASPSCG